MALNFANNSSLANITALPSSITGGGLTLVSSQTASSSASLEFSMDSTYDSYIFKFINIHPATDQASFQVNFRDGGSLFDATKTTTNFRAYHNEADTDTSLGYYAVEDLAQSTAVQIIGRTVGNGNDESCSGTLTLYAPSSTTFVKHFIVDSNVYEHSDYFVKYHIAGYINSTSPIDAIQFSFSTGNIDDGIIKMYGVS